LLLYLHPLHETVYDQTKYTINLLNIFVLLQKLQVRHNSIHSNGDGNLLLYHSDTPVPSAPGMTRITGRSLTEELGTNSSYRLAIVRRLKTPLSAQKTALIEEFVALNNGAIIPEQQRPSSVLMASSSSSPTQAFEHLECSDFVMMMLHLVGLVEPTSNPFEYVASDSRGRLLTAPITIKFKSSLGSANSGSLSGGISSGITTTTSYNSSCSLEHKQLSTSSSSNLNKRISLSSASSKISNEDLVKDSSIPPLNSPTSVVAHSHRSSRELLNESSPLEQTLNAIHSAPATPTKKK
jgi:hypothetical protein